MSLVLNGTTFKRTGYGYGYGYGYSYGINDQNPQLQKPFIARLKDWFIKWTWILSLLMIMIPMMKMAQNSYQPAELTWSVVCTLIGE